MFLSNIGKYENFKLVKVFINNVLLSKLISIGGPTTLSSIYIGNHSMMKNANYTYKSYWKVH